MGRRRAMEKTISEMEADLALLWSHADKFLKLAEEHAAAGHTPIARKLIEVASELNANIAALRSELSRAGEHLRKTA
jgi:phage shock protein A